MTPAQAIDQEVRGLVDQAHDDALSILRQNMALLETIAQKILEKEVIEVTTSSRCWRPVFFLRLFAADAKAVHLDNSPLKHTMATASAGLQPH